MGNFGLFEDIVEDNHLEVTTNFKMSWQSLVDEPSLKINWTPKAHQISDHFSDYFEDPLVKKQALGVTSDQIIEHMHSYINRMLTRSIYKLKLANTEKSAKRQHSGILKINAFATKIKK